MQALNQEKEINITNVEGLNKCFRCDQLQDGINHIMNLPVCREHSNWSQENIDKANAALRLDI